MGGRVCKIFAGKRTHKIFKQAIIYKKKMFFPLQRGGLKLGKGGWDEREAGGGGELTIQTFQVRLTERYTDDKGKPYLCLCPSPSPTHPPPPPPTDYHKMTRSENVIKSMYLHVYGCSSTICSDM